MLTVSARGVFVGLAYLTALCAVDLASHLVDVFALPLPHVALGLPWMGWVSVLVCVVLCGALARRPVDMFAWSDVAFLGALVLWGLLEMLHGSQGGNADPAMILAFLPTWLLAFACVLHLRTVGDVDLLVLTFVRVVIVVGAVHAAAVIVIDRGFVPGFVSVREITERNSLSLMLVAAVYLSLMRRRVVPGRVLALLLCVTALQIHVNHARGAAAILACVIAFGLWRHYARPTRFTRSAELFCGALIVAAAVGAYPLLRTLDGFAWFGAGDGALSTAYRAQANWLVMSLFAHQALLGAGWDALLNVRAGGYISHTLYLIVPAAYGLVGTLPILALAALAWRALPPEGRRRRGATLLFLCLVTTFVNDPLPWFGMLVALDAAGDKEST